MTGPKPIALPHIQQGNLLTDASQAVGNFVAGIQGQRDKNREQALQEALLGIRGMEAEGRLAQYGNQDNQRYLDDARTKGFFIRPGAGFHPNDLGELYTQGSPMQQKLMEYEMLPPEQRAKIPQPSRSITVGKTTADMFISPDQMREYQARAQAERHAASMAQRRAYLQLARERFSFYRGKPSENQLQIAGGVPNTLAASSTMENIENTLPDGANWAGMMKVIGETPLGKQFAPASTSGVVLTPEEQRYVIAMHRFLSEYFPAKGGKTLSETEVRQYFPIIAATGFTSRDAILDVQESRRGAIRQTMMGAGPALLMMIRNGQINPSDIPEGIIEDMQQMYGGDVVNPRRNRLMP